MNKLSELLAKLNDAATAEEAQAVLDEIAALLPDLDAEGVAAAHQGLTERAASLIAGVKESENPKADVAVATAIRDAREKVSTRANELAAEASELEATMAALAEEFTTPDPDESPDEDVDSDESPEPVEVEAQPEPVAASSAKPERAPLGRISKHRVREPEPEPDRPTVLTASSGVEGMRAGSPFGTPLDLGNAMWKASNALREGSGRIVVAQGRFGEELPVVPDDPDAAWLALAKVGRQAEQGEVITAAGGFCAPAQPVYEFFSIAARSGLLTLPTVQSTRGRITYPVSPGVADLLGQSGIASAWTNETDEDPGEATKPVFTPACVTTTTCEVVAYPTRLRFGNFSNLFYPEFVAHLTSEALITHDHKVDIALLAALSSLTTTSQVAGDTGGGTWVQVTQTLLWYAAWYRNKWRTGVDAPLDVILPAWVREALVADYVARSSTTDPSGGFAAVDRFFADANLRPQWLHNLNPIGGNPGGRFDPADVYIFAPGTVVRQTRATLDLGVVRDSTLNSTNDFETFVETFDGLCRPGHEVLKVNNVVTCPSGGQGALTAVSCPEVS